MKKSLVTALAIVAIFVSTLSLNAQEKGGKKNQADTMVAFFLKQLEKAELTADQTAKITEVYAKVAKEVSVKRTEGGITAEMLKKRTEAGKAAKEAGKKGKDMQEAVDAAVAMTPEQAKLFSETDVALNKARIEIAKLLTPEQIAKLPDQSQNMLKEKATGKKAKK